MNLVAAEPLQLVGIQCLAECLITNQWPIRQFLLPGLEPRQLLCFEVAAKTVGVGGGARLALFQFVGIAQQGIRPRFQRTGSAANASS
jgi:hypothetical protein